MKEYKGGGSWRPGSPAAGRALARAPAGAFRRLPGAAPRRSRCVPAQYYWAGTHLEPQQRNRPWAVRA
ncbi:MAG: hypothetical protein DBY09_00270 [Selenomonadales bacterium]|nr:MAG: hypothetical protein DBY09_00270 [Selenomonadales bacterium]